MDACSSYTHQPPHQVVGVGVILLGGELWGVKLGGPQDLQDAVQSLGHRDRAVLLGCVDDVYYLRWRSPDQNFKHKRPLWLLGRDTEGLCENVACDSLEKTLNKDI